MDINVSLVMDKGNRMIGQRVSGFIMREALGAGVVWVVVIGCGAL